MPAARATPSIETAWKPSLAAMALVASSTCSRRSSAVMRVVVGIGHLRLQRCNLRVRKLRHRNPGRRRSDQMTAETFDVAIVGSGFSGLATAINLKREAKRSFVVLERGDDVGGTWHYNTYPGCGCDVPSHLYSFSFAPNPEWSQTYSLQPEIRDYLRRCADDFGVRDRIRTNTQVTGAAWDEDERRWKVQTSQGEVRARVLVGAMGPLTEPKIPDIPGLDSFEGKTMHSARWDHSYDLKGKRMASVGTGASAIQYVPAIQPDVEQLHVFQRTPPWIFPHSNRAIRNWERRLYRAFPALQRLVRGGVYATREVAVLGFVKNPKLMGIAKRMAMAHMRKQLSDP